MVGVLTVLSYHHLPHFLIYAALLLQQQKVNRNKDSGSQPEVINHILGQESRFNELNS